jgi:hypothetical protein
MESKEQDPESQILYYVVGYTIYANVKIRRVAFSGTMTNRDILELGERIRKTSDGDLVKLNGLIDLRELTNIDMNFSVVSTFAAALRRRSLSNKVKVAILGNRPIQYGFARMLQSLLNHPQVEVEVFENENDAFDWLSNQTQ